MLRPHQVILEADCHSHEDALKLEAILTDLISNNDLAGEHVDQALLRYVTKEELEERYLQVEAEARRVQAKYNREALLV